MMDSIRRRFSATGRDPWSLEQSLDTDAETSELPLESTVLLAQSPSPPSNEVELREYYRGLIVTAMKHGGWYREHQISIPWLRMTLAGLEMRPMPAEMMWEGVQPSTYPESADYGKLFPEKGPGL